VARAAAELAIIVTGVLIALGAQSWWETQGEAEERDRALTALSADLGVIATALEERQTAASVMSEGLVRVIEEVDLQSLTDSTYITTVQDAAWTHLGDGRFPFPAFTDLQSSGRLRLLPDTIRIALTRFAHTLDLVDNAFADLQDVQENQLDPWVAQNFDAARVVWRPGIGYAYPGLPDAGPLGTREGRSRVAMKHAVVTSLRRNLSSAAGEAAELQAAIQQTSP
jgi:hypothetical protein